MRTLSVVVCVAIAVLALLAPGEAAPAPKPEEWLLHLERPGDRPARSYRLTYEFAGQSGQGFDATRWGFERRAAFFYEHELGHYPRVYNGKAENGGIPQRANLEAHLGKVRFDVERKIPDPDWDGFGIIDFESWGPLLAGNQPFYREESRRFIAAERPGIGEEELERRARASFESAARTFLLKTLEACRAARPRAKWGFYCYPQPYHKSIEKQLAWLWDAVDVLYPGFYFSNYGVIDGQPTEGQTPIGVTIQQMRDHLGMARRIADAQKQRKLVVPLLSPRYFEVNKVYAWRALNDADAEITLRLPWLCGADGAVFWDDVRNEADAALLRRYFESTFGPAALRLREEVKARAKETGGEGR